MISTLILKAQAQDIATPLCGFTLDDVTEAEVAQHKMLEDIFPKLCNRRKPQRQASEFD